MKQIKSIYLRNIYEEIIKRKKLLFIFVLLFTIVFGGYGYKKGISGLHPSKEQEQEIKEYDDTITEYDNTLSELDSSVEQAQKQIDQLQDYVDHSIYMKLDSQNIHAASAQFAILNSGNTGNILTSFIYYINEGGLLKDLSDEYTDAEAKYLKEIILSSTGGNVLNVTVYHDDEDQAEELLKLIEIQLNKNAVQIAKSQGTFTIQKIDSSIFTKTDVNVANIQNNNRNNLKNFLSNKVDLQNKRISQENIKNSYIEKNGTKISAITQENPYKEGIKFAVVGAVFGVLLLWCYYTIKFILGDQLRSKEDLSSANLTVISTYNLQKGYLPSIDRVLMDIQLWSEQNQMHKIYLSILNGNEFTSEIIKDFLEKIGQIGLTANVGYHVNDNAEELKNMIFAKYTIVIVQAGKTTYSQINDHISLCEKFGVKILGYVVSE